MPTTAANWWLFLVACMLKAQNATKSKSRNGLSRQSDGGSPVAIEDRLLLATFFPTDFDRALALPPAAVPARDGCDGSPEEPCGAAADPESRTPTSQTNGIKKLSAPRTMVARCSCNGRFHHPLLAMKRGIGLSSAMFCEKIGLLMVPASSSG